MILEKEELGRLLSINYFMIKQLNKVEGLTGEVLASNYLINKKYKIIKQNYSNNMGEIDIIAMQNKTIVFVEVKARKTLAFGRPSEAVNQFKQRKIKNVAKLYLIKNHLLDKDVRFDVIEIIGDDEINHIENAF